MRRINGENGEEEEEDDDDDEDDEETHPVLHPTENHRQVCALSHGLIVCALTFPHAQGGSPYGCHL
jgi:hypothetical protein